MLALCDDFFFVGSAIQSSIMDTCRCFSVCQYPYTSLGTECVCFFDCNVTFRDMRLPVGVYSSPCIRVGAGETYRLIHCKVQQHNASDQCAFCLESRAAPKRDYSRVAVIDRWDVIHAFPMYSEMELDEAENARMFLVCPCCREFAVDGIANSSKRVLLQYFGDCAFYLMDAYDGYDY